jgi:hypothetical protein
MDKETEISGYQDHLRRIDIPAWEYGSGDWFVWQLFSLMSKADTQNFYRLERAFPEEAAAWVWWNSGKPEYETKGQA